MNMSEIAIWSQVISSAAVLITLVYLAIQTKQTSVLLKSESRQSILENDQTTAVALIECPEIIVDCFSDDELSMKSKIRLHGWLITFMRLREHLWIQYKDGVLDDKTWKSYEKAILSVFSIKRNRDWWEIIGQRHMAKEYAEHVSNLLDNIKQEQELRQLLIRWP